MGILVNRDLGVQGYVYVFVRTGTLRKVRHIQNCLLSFFFFFSYISFELYLYYLKETRVVRRQQSAPNGCLSVMASKYLDHTFICTEDIVQSKNYNHHAIKSLK